MGLFLFNTLGSFSNSRVGLADFSPSSKSSLSKISSVILSSSFAFNGSGNSSLIEEIFMSFVALDLVEGKLKDRK